MWITTLFTLAPPQPSISSPSHDVCYVWNMGRSIHVRLDDASAAALRLLGSEAASESEAVRLALTETAERRVTRHSLRKEALRLAADSRDRAEMAAVRDLMAELAPTGQDHGQG